MGSFIQTFIGGVGSSEAEGRKGEEGDGVERLSVDGPALARNGRYC